MSLSDSKFELTKLTLGSVVKFKGKINGVKFEDQFDPEVISAELSERWRKIAPKLENNLIKNVPLFSNIKGRLSWLSLEIGTIGKGEDKKPIYSIQMTNLEGPTKNKIISGEITGEGLPKGFK